MNHRGALLHALVLCPRLNISIVSRTPNINRDSRYGHILRKLREHINIYLCTIASEQTEQIKSTQPLGLEITISLEVLNKAVITVLLIRPVIIEAQHEILINR
jgi:hypothetical protein